MRRNPKSCWPVSFSWLQFLLDSLQFFCIGCVPAVALEWRAGFGTARVGGRKMQELPLLQMKSPRWRGDENMLSHFQQAETVLSTRNLCDTDTIPSQKHLRMDFEYLPSRRPKGSARLMRTSALCDFRIQVDLANLEHLGALLPVVPIEEVWVPCLFQIVEVVEKMKTFCESEVVMFTELIFLLMIVNERLEEGR